MRHAHSRRQASDITDDVLDLLVRKTINRVDRVEFVAEPILEDLANSCTADQFGSLDIVRGSFDGVQEDCHELGDHFDQSVVLQKGNFYGEKFGEQ